MIYKSTKLNIKNALAQKYEKFTLVAMCVIMGNLFTFFRFHVIITFIIIKCNIFY